ncbi:MAG: ATP-dependent Clp protease ATP-binding subunit, partial [Phycisphaerales bacterium]|nr:ATP-dependent Clp protease ATP-binding subunit [Phycisphaerales bacterium]
MPALPLTLHLVTQHLAGGLLLAEPVLFPEVQVCHDRPDKVHALARGLAADAAGRLAGAEWHRRTLGQRPRAGTVRLTIDPPRHQAAWTEPLDCALDYVWWPHGDQSVVGYFPAVGIEVIARTLPDLEARAPEHLRAAVRRLMGAVPAKDNDQGRRPGRPRPAVGSLYRLALLRRVERVELSATEVVVELASPKRRHAEADAAADKPMVPLIEQVGRVLSAAGADPEPAYEVDALVARVAEALGGRSPRPVLLVGPAGVGKTAIVRELVRRRDELGLAGVPVWQTSGARLVAGQTGFGMWQERCVKLCREAAAARAVVHLGNLFELVEVGQADGSGPGIGGFLKPYLLRGDLLAVAECTPEQLTLVERLDPHLVEAFAVVRAEEPTPAAAARIVARRAADLGDGLVHLTPAGLDLTMRLHRRYAGYSALPARPLGFVGNLVRDAFAAHPDGFPTGRHEVGPADVTAAFARQTGLPRFLLDDALPLDLPATRATLAGRVIGQPAAVDLLADLIATVKAGLARPRRPVASLLFIGPTGVGKTEMAKALAAFFFGSADRMARFDMSEFGTAYDVQRLVGGVPGGAAATLGGGSATGRGAAAEGLLTAKVREQPFAVVLLDEVEKAHPLLFDLLLQVLGEGRLTDAAGRVADFTNAVVVMTSNLGAERFGQAGFGLREAGGAGGDAAAHFTEAVRDFLRPELFNRIDRIVPILP